jgi:hypothetical protein
MISVLSMFADFTSLALSKQNGSKNTAVLFSTYSAKRLLSGSA